MRTRKRSESDVLDVRGGVLPLQQHSSVVSQFSRLYNSFLFSVFFLTIHYAHFIFYLFIFFHFLAYSLHQSSSFFFLPNLMYLDILLFFLSALNMSHFTSSPLNLFLLFKCTLFVLPIQRITNDMSLSYILSSFLVLNILHNSKLDFSFTSRTFGVYAPSHRATPQKRRKLD